MQFTIQFPCISRSAFLISAITRETFPESEHAASETRRATDFS